MLRRARQIYQAEGLIPLVRRGFAFLLYHIFEYRAYYLTEYNLENLRQLNEANFMPRMDDFAIRIVTSNQEADALEANGLEFASASGGFRFDARRALDSGAIAFCTYVGKELATIGWVALTQQAMDSLNERPMRVDFSKGESFTGNIWTNPKYRRMGLRLYRMYKKRQFLAEKGIRATRGYAAKRNVDAVRGIGRIDSTVYGEGRYLRVLWWKSWKEKPLTPDSGKQRGRRMRRLASLPRRSKQIYCTEGLGSLLQRGLAFASWLIFEYRTYYLYMEAMECLRLPNEEDVLPKVNDCTFKLVTTNREADELEAEGLEFRSYVQDSTYRLNRGALAFCFFVGQELANIGWVALTQEAKDALDEPPYRVDFSNYEACTGGVWTNPKYRRMGIQTYGFFKRLEFLRAKGIQKKRYVIAKDNVAPQKGRAMRGVLSLPGPHAEGRYLRILWWKWWMEKQLTLDSDKEQSNAND
jgi:hypothetical protein